MATMAAHLQADPKPIRQRRPDVPPALEAVVLKAMRRFPEHRYQSAREIVVDLDRLDALDVSSFDLGPEEPMGGLAASQSTKRLWALVALVAVTFAGIVAVILVIANLQ